MIIASAVQLVEMVLKKYSPALFRALGIYLPLITTNCAVLGVALFQTAREYDFVQSMVFSFGGGVLLALNLAFFTFSEDLGVPGDLAVRINLASAGIWWLGFSFITWGRLRSRRAARQLPTGETYVSIGFKQLRKTVGEVKHFPETLKFLIAYFLYNDGIQTVIAVASTFAAAPC